MKTNLTPEVKQEVLEWLKESLAVHVYNSMSQVYDYDKGYVDSGMTTEITVYLDGEIISKTS